MADGWLLHGIQDLVDKIKLLESEKTGAVAKIEALERENCELASIIAQASAKVAEVLNEGRTVGISEPITFGPTATSMARERPGESSASPQ